jgi:hypothetical protein
LAGKRLPEGSIVVSAVNEGDEYQLTDLDPALVSRFNLYEFAPTAEDWLLWAAENEVDERVTTFIQQNNQYLDGDEKAGDEDQLTAHAGLVKTPDRRAWVKVANFSKPLERIEDVHIKIIAGVVGSSAAMMFKKSLVRTLPVTPEQVLLQLDKCKKRLKELALWLNAGRCPPGKEDKARTNLLGYLKFLQSAQQLVEQWFLVEPLLFAVWTTHELAINPRIRGIRVQQGRMEYNPAFIDALDRNGLEQVLGREAMRILLKHPYVRRPGNAELAYAARGRSNAPDTTLKSAVAAARTSPP